MNLTGELHGRDEEIYGLTAKLRAIDSEEESRQMALRNMQDQLSSVTEQHCLTSQRLNEAQVSADFIFKL